MWDEMVNKLTQFTSAVLTGMDADGYPFSVRCQPDVNQARKTLHIQLADSVSIQPGPAGLLCHSHDEALWNLKSFLVRGRLEKGDNDWVFRPDTLIPGGGINGPISEMKALFKMRATANNYLQKRGIPRPKVAWNDLKALREESKKTR